MSHPAAEPARCSEPTARWHSTSWMLMSWDEAAEILNLCYEKEKKTFNPNLFSESLAGVMGMSVAARPVLQGCLQDVGGIPPQSLSPGLTLPAAQKPVLWPQGAEVCPPFCLCL